jgi:PAS domain S-box-containing protein
MPQSGNGKRTYRQAYVTKIPNDSEPQNLYKMSWNYAQDGKVAVDAATGIILDANPAMETLTGYSRAELIGMHVTMLHPGVERALVEAEFRKEMLQPVPHFDLHIQRKGRGLAPVAIWSSVKLRLAGRMLIIGEFRDIAVNNDAMKHLAQMEARYRGLMEAAPDGMVVVNQGGEIVLLNARAESQFGYRRDELLGQKVTNIIPEGFAERLIADGTRTAAEALAQQIGTGIELKGRRKDGTEFPIEIMLSPLENDEGILVTAAIRDITLKVEKEHRLTAQNWALSAYASAALALGRVHSSESLLLQAICEAITRESIYVLAWVGIAEEGPEKRIRIAASAGQAIRYLDGLNLSWSEGEAWGKASTDICIRTSTLQRTDDTQISPAFALWHEGRGSLRYDLRFPFPFGSRMAGMEH